MRQTWWKLTALAGVVGIGLLIVMQAQQRLNKKDANADANAVADLGESATPPPGGGDDVALNQNEPGQGSDGDGEIISRNQPVPADAKTSGGPKLAGPARAVPADDPFDISNDDASSAKKVIATPQKPATMPRGLDFRELDEDEPAVDSKKSKTVALAGKSAALPRNLDDEEPLPRSAAPRNDRPAAKAKPSKIAEPLDDTGMPPGRTSRRDLRAGGQSTEPDTDGPRLLFVTPDRSAKTVQDKEPAQPRPNLKPVKNEPADLFLDDDSQPASGGSPKKVDASTPAATSNEPMLQDDEELPRSRPAPLTAKESIKEEPDDKEPEEADEPAAKIAIGRGKVATIKEDSQSGDDEKFPAMAQDDDKLPPAKSMPSVKPALPAAKPAPAATRTFDDEDDKPVKISPPAKPKLPVSIPAVTDADEKSSAFDDEKPSIPEAKPRSVPVVVTPPEQDPVPRVVPDRVPEKQVIVPQRDPAFSVDKVDSPDLRRGPQGTQRPQLTLDKIAPPNAILGQPMVYQIVVKNVGVTTANQVVVEDIVPRGVELKGTIPQAELGGNKLVWRIGSLEPGQLKRISVRVIPLTEGEVGSVATVNFAAEVGAQTVISAPKLNFEVLAPDQTTVGTPVVINFRVTNMGRGDASGVVIRDVLPAGLRHPDGDDLEYEIGPVPAGTMREIQLTLTAAQVGRTVNRAVVTADGGVTVPATVQIDVLGPSLSVTRNGPKRMLPGKTGGFTNTVSNTATNPMQNISITETIPQGMEFVSASSDGQYDTNRRTVTWKIDRIEPRQSKTVDITLKSTAPGSFISVIRASDANGATGEAMGTSVVTGVAALGIDMGEIPSLVELGDKLPVKIRILNRGSDVATNVRTSVIVPRTMQVLTAKGPGQFRRNGDAVEFDPIGRIDPRGEAAIELTLQAIGAGEMHLSVTTQSDQSQPVRREESLTIAQPQQ